MHLAELRFGIIPDVDRSRPGMWLIVKQEFQNKQSSISKGAQFDIWITSVRGSEKPLVTEGEVSAVVHSVTTIQSDTYALLYTLGHDHEVSSFEKVFGTSLNPSQSFVVQLQNKKRGLEHLSAVWKATNN